MVVVTKSSRPRDIETPWHWPTVVMSEWTNEHIDWLKSQNLAWTVDYYIVDHDEPLSARTNYKRTIRQVYFLFKDEKYATLFLLRWKD